MTVSLRGTYIFFSSHLCVMHVKAPFIKLCCFVYSFNQGNAVLVLFHKHHLLSKSEFVSHSELLLSLLYADVLCNIVSQNLNQSNLFYIFSLFCYMTYFCSTKKCAAFCSINNKIIPFSFIICLKSYFVKK